MQLALVLRRRSPDGICAMQQCIVARGTYGMCTSARMHSAGARCTTNGVHCSTALLYLALLCSVAEYRGMSCTRDVTVS